MNTPLRIPSSSDCCTVIATVDADPTVLVALEAHARAGLEHFPSFPGFLGGALHRSGDGERLVQYLQWSSRAEYERCIDDPSWDALPSTRHFLDAVHEGRARLNVRVFDVVMVAPGADAS